MARTTRYETVTPEPMQVKRADYRCDSCGGPISPDGTDDAGNAFANELTVMLNPDECMCVIHGRDYCTACLRPLWEALCKIIGADPDAIGDQRQDDA